LKQRAEEQIAAQATGPLFTSRRILLQSLAFVLPLILLNRLLRWIDLHVIDFDRPPYWPIGVFEPRAVGWAGLSIVALCCGVAWLGEVAARKRRYPLPLILGPGLGLVIGTNLIHGVSAGLATPIAGGQPAIQYYHDSLRITSAAAFLRDFTRLQPELLDHGRTHPPGAVLAIHWLRLLVERPEWISLLIAAASVMLSGFFLHRVLAECTGHTAAGYATLLFLLLPAVQIYYCASVDALIATAMLGSVYFSVRRRGGLSLAGAAGCLFAASFLTFAAVFVVPVLFAYEYVARRSGRRTACVVAATAAVYVGLYGLSGFNYWQSFRIAAALENPQGFRLLADPFSYFATRLECVLEIAVFFGPFLIWLVALRLRELPSISPPMAALFWSAIAGLSAMLLAGVFHTAETARAALFVYPFLVCAIAAGSNDGNGSQCVRVTTRWPLSGEDRSRLAMLVFGQSVLMQAFGAYFW